MRLILDGPIDFSPLRNIHFSYDAHLQSKIRYCTRYDVSYKSLIDRRGNMTDLTNIPHIFINER